MDISLRETGSGRVALVVGEWRKRMLDMTPALERIADHLREAEQEAFDRAGANLPKPWRPLSHRTAERKAEAGYDHRVLVRRGDLMRSLTTRNDARHVERVRPGELYFGTRSPVARLLRAQGRNPVQRPRDTRTMAQIIADHIAGHA